MLKNLFQEARWDYVYYLRRGSNDEEQLRRLTILFKDGKVDSFNSDPMPSETMADNLILGRDPKFVPKAPEHHNKPPVNPTPTPGL
jgi:outer membrane protein assembly factor BamE (lipoprotein component of BamABCDE complex)